MAASEQELLKERQGHRLTLTINRPKRRNAITGPVIKQIIETLQEADQDPEIRVIVITGAGEKAFCAGGDLAADMSDQDGAAGAVQAYANLAVTMAGLGTPLIARVNGVCMGGGVGLMLGCDLAVACDDVKFGTPEVRSGLFPMIISPIIIRNVGAKRAMEMILTGRRYTAHEAVAMGLINLSVRRDRLDAEVQQLVDEILLGSPSAIRIGRRAISEVRDQPLEQAASTLGERLLEVIATEDAMEGISAFVEKRKPEWKGR